MSRPAASIISGMLTRNPARRLGARGPKQVASLKTATHHTFTFSSPWLTRIALYCYWVSQVMDHDFFRGLDWKALLEKRINAPLNPCRNQSPDSLSTQNFDPQWVFLNVSCIGAPWCVTASLTLHFPIQSYPQVHSYAHQHCICPRKCFGWTKVCNYIATTINHLFYF